MTRREIIWWCIVTVIAVTISVAVHLLSYSHIVVILVH